MELNEKYFEVSHIFNPERRPIWKVIARQIQNKFIPADSVVLELGAGYCDFINQIKAREKYAVDISNIIEKYAAPEVKTFIHDCVNLSMLKNNSITTVFASNLLEHLNREETNKTLVEIERVLTKNGRLILLQPNFKYSYRNYFDDFTHRQIFTHVSLPDLLKAHGFLIRKIYPKFLPFSMRGRLPAYPLLVKLYLYSPWKPLAGQMLVIAEK